MNNSIKFIESISTPNDYVQHNIQPKSVKKRFHFRKLDILDIFMIPVALITAVSIGFLIYQISKLGTDISELAGVIGAFVK